MFTLRVPASSANLGPGFDALGLALGVYLTCRFQRGESLVITASGRDSASIPSNADNLIWWQVEGRTGWVAADYLRYPDAAQ